MCFNAFLPSSQGKTILTGTLTKLSKRSVRYSRNWYILKSDTLSFYNSSTDVYFPVGSIDLRYALQADLVPNSSGDKFKSKAFKLVTEKRTYIFKTDTVENAQLWVKSLQNVIFLAHNRGDRVTIKIPIENIIDLEESNLNEFGKALKLRAIDSDETFSIDEYVLAFLHPSQKFEVPLNAIRRVMEQKGIENIKTTNIPSEQLFEEIAETRKTLGKVTDSTNSFNALDMQESASPTAESNDEFFPFSYFSPGRKTSKRSTLETESNASGLSKGSGPSLIHPKPLSFPPSVRSGSSRPMSPVSDTRSSSTLNTNISSSKQHLGTELLGPAFTETQEDHTKPKERPSSVFLNSLSFGNRRNKSPSRSSSPSSMMDSQDSFLDLSKEKNMQSHSRPVSPSVSAEHSKSADLETKRKKRATIVHKLGEMFSSSIKHYHTTDNIYNLKDGDGDEDFEKYMMSEDETNESNERFRSHFSFGEDEELVATYYAHIQKPYPIYGKIYLSNGHICFRSLMIGSKTKMILPLKDVENVSSENGFKFGYSGLVFIIHGHEEVFFEFSSRSARDDCESTVRRLLDIKKMTGSGLANSTIFADVDPSEKLRIARLQAYEKHLREDGTLEGLDNAKAIVFSDPNCIEKEEPPIRSLHFTMLTIGSRGDVQPYIALCKGLMKEGHKCRIATHIEFKDWIESYGIEFRTIAGDPGELMKIMIEHGMLSVSFLRDAASKFRGWIDELLHTSWLASQGTDVLIESPSAMAGLHVAEALQIPYFRAFTMPWTRTRTYPHAFMVPEQKLGGSYNHLTYVLFDNVFWKGISGQINKWRVRELGLEKTNLDLMQQGRVPFLYNVSPSVLVPPVDYADWVKVTGYWFLDEGNKDYKPPKELVDFIAKAKKDKKKIVYIGFGSIVVSDSTEMTKTVIEAVKQSGVRCILSKGWSERYNAPDSANVEVPLPPEIHLIKSAPHDWLFPQMDAAVHHGGSGTTGASLRAGLPTVIKPFFGDQFFYAGRVEDLGVGVCLRKLSVNAFSKALIEVTTNEKIIKKSYAIGCKIRKEDGVSTAIASIYWEMDYATSLIKKRKPKDSASKVIQDGASDSSIPVINLDVTSEGNSSTEKIENEDCTSTLKSVGGTIRRSLSTSSRIPQDIANGAISSLKHVFSSHGSSSRSSSPSRANSDFKNFLVPGSPLTKETTLEKEIDTKKKSSINTNDNSAGSYSSDEAQKTDESWTLLDEESS